MKKIILLPLVVLLLFSGCSKSPGKTAAKLKLKLSGIVDLTTGIGSGGAIIFGRSTNGNIFGKRITGVEENLDLPNGAWVFYSFMWDSAGPSTPMNGKVYCGKAAQSLTGTDTSISLNLSNANCTDPEFSEGRVYFDGTNNHFANLFLEECDQVVATTGFNCGIDNQGSGASYRLKFQSFKKPAGAPFQFEGDPIISDCRPVPSLHTNGYPINFPSGSLATPFVVSIEVFMSSPSCDTTDPKGVFQATLDQGLRSPAPAGDKVLFSTSAATANISDFSGLPTLADQKKKCLDLLGSWSGSSCLSIPPVIARFAPVAVIASQAAEVPAIKHLFQIPKSFLCDRYNGSSAMIGVHPFAGGDGSLIRPYKICTEWQINQIGEFDALTALETMSYKLMNDLDMNKTDFIGPYAKPSCVGAPGSFVKDHHNLNPLSKIANSTCSTAASLTPFTGTFNGDGKTIRNARISASAVDDLGFARKMDGGVIKNLNFKNLEVEGRNSVGGIVGTMDSISGAAEISNISLNDINVEARSNAGADGNYVGGIAGNIVGTNTVVNNIHINGARVRGRSYIAGLAGSNSGKISKSHFRGTLENYDSSGSLIGGLVANNGTGAFVTDSYSEGSIESYLAITGGVVGGNFGTVDNVYSTMSILSNYMAANAHVGGIVSDNSSGGVVSNAFFDGAINHVGGSTPVIGGVISTNGGGTDSNCFSAITPGGTNCTTTSASLIRDGSRTFAVPAAWTQLSGSIPRLAWETRECLSAANQQSFASQSTNFGRGAETNPYIICNTSQLSSLSNLPSTNFYRLAEDIQLSALTPASVISVFNGNLFGNDKILYGANLNFPDDADEVTGIFKNISSTGKIGKLKLYNNIISNTADIGDIATGGLAGQNSGLIKKIEVFGNSLNGVEQVGLVAGVNNGTISDSSLIKNFIAGYHYTGGVAGTNASGAKIQRVDVQSDIKPYSTGGLLEEWYGGIAGTNFGLIDQVRFGGMISIPLISNAANLHVGGIAAYNDGTISNAYTDNYSKITVKDNRGVGGLVGQNDTNGSVSNSFAVGKVVYDNGAGGLASAVPTFHSLIANNAGAAPTNTFYLEQNIGSFLGSNSLFAACTGTGCQTNSVYDSTNADLFGLSYGGGNGLSSLTSMTPTSTTFFDYIGSPMSSGMQLDFFKSYAITPTTGVKTAANFGTLSTFCSSWTGTVGNEVCSAGYDIAQEGVQGTNRVMAYYNAYFNDLPAPANTPIWSMETGDGYPKLMQIDHH